MSNDFNVNHISYRFYCDKLVSMDLSNNLIIESSNNNIEFKSANQTISLNKTNITFDIIIDDGGHTMKQQQTSFGVLFKNVSSGGLYILEDLHTSIWETNLAHGGHFITNDDEITSLEMLKKFNVEKKNNIKSYDIR